VPKAKVDFVGFLANVDDSILKLEPGDDFVVEKLPQEETLPFLRKIDFHYGADGSQAVLDFDHGGMACGCYCMSKSHVTDFERTAQGGVVIKPAKLKSIERTLRDKIRLLRLFKEGNILLRFSFFYHMKDSQPSVIRIGREGPMADRTMFRLENKEASTAQSFIRNWKIPFVAPSVELAFESFELSYEVHNRGLAFLSLMISLETMLNPADRELRYRVSRNAAVLLGRDREDSKRVFKEVKVLYDKRSKLVHTGNNKLISQEDVLRLRDCVRKSIKQILAMNKNKDQLLEMLNSSGFGERAWERAD
jgi:hypothetical protein